MFKPKHSSFNIQIWYTMKLIIVPQGILYISLTVFYKMQNIFREYKGDGVYLE
jgi:hypothetical protein